MELTNFIDMDLTDGYISISRYVPFEVCPPKQVISPDLEILKDLLSKGLLDNSVDDLLS